MIVRLVYIALGGAVGALGRYAISGIAQRAVDSAFPWGTLTVNVIGSLIIGALAALFDRVVVAADIRMFLTIGFLGAFTTFSTYSFETVNLLRDGELKLALMNILMNNVLAIVLAALGFVLMRLILERATA